MSDYIPRHGDAVDRWLEKWQTEAQRLAAHEDYSVLTCLRDEYRRAANAGVPLDAVEEIGQ